MWYFIAVAALIVAALAELDAYYWRKRVREYRAYVRKIERGWYDSLDARYTLPTLEEWTAEISGRPSERARGLRVSFRQQYLTRHYRIRSVPNGYIVHLGKRGWFLEKS